MDPCYKFGLFYICNHPIQLDDYKMNQYLLYHLDNLANIHQLRHDNQLYNFLLTKHQHQQLRVVYLHNILQQHRDNQLYNPLYIIHLQLHHHHYNFYSTQSHRHLYNRFDMVYNISRLFLVYHLYIHEELHNIYFLKNGIAHV